MEEIHSQKTSPAELLLKDTHVKEVVPGKYIDTEGYCVGANVPERIEFEIGDFQDVALRYLSDPLIFDDFESYEDRKEWKAGLDEGVWQEVLKNKFRLNRFASAVRQVFTCSPQGGVFRHCSPEVQQEMTTVLADFSREELLTGYGKADIEEKKKRITAIDSYLKNVCNIFIQAGYIEGEMLH